MATASIFKASHTSYQQRSVTYYSPPKRKGRQRVEKEHATEDAAKPPVAKKNWKTIKWEKRSIDRESYELGSVMGTLKYESVFLTYLSETRNSSKSELTAGQTKFGI